MPFFSPWNWEFHSSSQDCLEWWISLWSLYLFHPSSVILFTLTAFGYYGVGQKALSVFRWNWKTHFSFSRRTLLNNTFTILFHCLLLFFRQPHNSIFSKLFIFLSKELFQVPFTDFQETEIFFHLENFVKTFCKWTSKGAMAR